MATERDEEQDKARKPTEDARNLPRPSAESFSPLLNDGLERIRDSHC
jgi:hypothetical protein